ncbi:glutathione S-transferase family protein [Pseudomonas cavernicola]|uniref:glutathione transferase n=1 Tax=Pseudomonas cavernicola TaxID=2320866 RepID=A0A418XM66_9PSED|nr:glutathione S-transferase family protein [Pseudomonas cavernicola]RJG13569.1 glutathione S-transferase family protein [Pseudomonas cavernicola]
MKPRLISFKLCPFVQRAAIALQYKTVEYDIEYIDLANPPEWFLKISPLKKVPLLLVEDHVIFESTVINEYIDEAYPNKLHPSDLILRAHNRSWIEFGNGCTWSAFHLSVKEKEEDFNNVLDDLLNKFDQIEKAIGGAPFFNGSKFSLVDSSYAPLFQRLEYLDELRPGILDKKRHPRINAWKESLLTLNAVQRSAVPEIKELYHELLWKRQGYISQFLDEEKYGKNSEKRIY